MRERNDRLAFFPPFVITISPGQREIRIEKEGEREREPCFPGISDSLIETFVSRLDVGLTVPSVASIQSCASTSLSLFVNCN